MAWGPQDSNLGPLPHSLYLAPPGKKKPLSSPSLGSLQQREGAKAEVGDQVLVAGQKQGVVRFYGKTDFAPGEDGHLGWEEGRASWHSDTLWLQVTGMALS